MISVVNRQWYNDANTSTWFFVPGLIVLIMTMVGVFLTTMVMAREWERGTLESLFVTPVKPLEIVLSKWIPYFFVSMGGFILCMIAARYLFHVHPGIHPGDYPGFCNLSSHYTGAGTYYFVAAERSVYCLSDRFAGISAPYGYAEWFHFRFEEYTGGHRCGGAYHAGYLLYGTA